MPAAFAAALIALTEAARTGRASGAGNGIDLDQDSVALGICNLAAGLVHGVPITASPPPEGGRRQGWSPVAPDRGLLRGAASGQPGAVDALLTLLAVLTLGVLVGALVMAVLALLNMLRTVSRPHDRLLRTAGREEPPDLVVHRFNAPLFFANARHLDERVQSAMAAAGSGVRWLVLDAEAIEDLDATAVEVLARVHDDLEAREVTLVIAGARADLLGVENLHETVGSAVASLRAAGRGQSGLGAYPDGRGQLE